MISKASPLFHYAYLIIIKVTFSFPKFVSSYKKSPHFITWSLRYSRFQSSKTLKAMPIFHHHHPKFVKVTFSFLEFVSTHQKSIYFIHFSLTYSQFQSLENRVTTPTPIFFNQLLFSMNLHQHAKNQTFSSFCSRNIVDLRIL